jgi:hypothetical protein
LYETNLLGMKILKHWRTHLPQMVAELEKNNQLQQRLHEVQELTGDLLYELAVVQKMDYQAAWEIATREWAFLPTEDPRPSSANSTPSPKKPTPATSE